MSFIVIANSIKIVKSENQAKNKEKNPVDST